MDNGGKQIINGRRWVDTFFFVRFGAKSGQVQAINRKMYGSKESVALSIFVFEPVEVQDKYRRCTGKLNSTQSFHPLLAPITENSIVY